MYDDHEPIRMFDAIDLQNARACGFWAGAGVDTVFVTTMLLSFLYYVGTHY